MTSQPIPFARLTREFASLLLAIVAFFTISTVRAADGDIRVNAGGSTFIAPFMRQCEVAYHKDHSGIKIDYQSIGSKGGVNGLIAKDFDFGATDVPLDKAQLKELGDEVVQIPIIAGAVVVAYNLPDIKGELRLSGPTTAEIYLNRITNWNDAKIAELNPDMKLPDLRIVPVHRTDGSGTNYFFTKYLSNVSDDFQRLIGSGTQVEWLEGMGSKGGEGILGPVRTIKGAIGYVEYIHARQNDVPFAVIRNREGKWVHASPKGATAALEACLPQLEKGRNATLSAWDAPEDDSYPITGLSLIIVRRDLGYLKDRAKAGALIEFLKWATTDGQKLAVDLDYGTLGAGLQNEVAKLLHTITYYGKPILSVEPKK